jgi:hypothetical protein
MKFIYNFHCDWLLSDEDIKKLRLRFSLLNCSIIKIKISRKSGMNIQAMSNQNLDEDQKINLLADLGAIEADYRNLNDTSDIFPLRVVWP